MRYNCPLTVQSIHRHVRVLGRSLFDLYMTIDCKIKNYGCSNSFFTDTGLPGSLSVPHRANPALGIGSLAVYTRIYDGKIPFEIISYN